MNTSAFDSDNHLLKVRPQKTSRKKRDLIIPLHPQLETHVFDTAVADGDGALCPTLSKRKVGGKHGLSVQFHTILKEAGVKQETVEAAGDAGHDFNKYTFHSLRHSFVSELANAGVAPDVRQLLAGHSEDRSHAVYTHTQIDTLRSAVTKLPSIKM